MRIIILLIVFSCFLNCGTSNSRKDRNEPKGVMLPTLNEAKTELDEDMATNQERNGIKLNCSITDSIIVIINEYIESNKIGDIDGLTLYRLFLKNHDDETPCHFPRSGLESDLINVFTLNILNATELGEAELTILFYLFDACRRNIELVEYIQSRFATIILHEFEVYFSMVSGLDLPQQKRAIGLIEFIHSKDDLYNLKVEVMNSVHSSNNDLVSYILKVIDEEIARK